MDLFRISTFVLRISLWVFDEAISHSRWSSDDLRGCGRGKLDYVKRLGAARTACIGNGRNDRLMLKAAALGIAVLQGEGAAGVTLAAADIVMPAIAEALDLLTNPLRLIASLRS